MDISILKKEIKILTETLTEQIDTVLKYTDKVPQIEMDILMGNIRKLYEDFYLIDKMNQNSTVKVQDELKIQETEADTERKPEIPPKKVVTEKPQPAPAIVEPKPEIPKPVIEKKPEPAPPPQKVEVKAEPEIPGKPVETDTKVETAKAVETKKKQKVKSTADLFTDAQDSVADKFMNGKDDSLGARMQKNKITDLKKAIGINEKFLFINELFEGNMQDYNDAIAKLNTSTTKPQAMVTITGLKTKFRWEDENEAFTQFMDIIDRRF